MGSGRQLGLFDVLYVDSFAGGGGASTGIELATGHPVDIAINHDQSAIMMHKQNHPFTEHYREDIWKVDPIKATRGRPVRLAWFSPDCKHFSRAKGAALVDRNIRGLAWVVLRWAGIVHPDIIMLENVPEFVTWGPVRKGKPVKSKAGQTYRKWYKQLGDLGYKIETRELCAADYGAPTIRTRFCLIARRDGQPIKWPERTHAPADSKEVRSGKYLPWRSAAEIIDWTQPCYSIFDSKAAIKEKYGVNAVRPLKPNTMRRIARGLDKFVIKSASPFIVECNHDSDRRRPITEPLNTITRKYTGGYVSPVVTPYVVSNNANNAPHSVNEPVPTITTGNRNFLLAPSLIQYHGEKSAREMRGQALDTPLQTVDAANRYGLSATFLSEWYGNAREGIDITRPVQTITGKDRESLTVAHLHKYFTGVDGAELTAPLPTVTAVDHNSVTLTHIVKYKGQNLGQHPQDPLQVITTSAGEFGEVRTTVTRAAAAVDLGYWPQIREMLNAYCSYNLAEDEVLLMSIRGAWYFIRDVGLRMLTPRELYDAMGFPHDYIIDQDVTGRPISRAAQVARCGNAVCPAVAEAMVRANLKECPKRRIHSMDALYEAMTS